MGVFCPDLRKGQETRTGPETTSCLSEEVGTPVRFAQSLPFGVRDSFRVVSCRVVEVTPWPSVRWRGPQDHRGKKLTHCDPFNEVENHRAGGVDILPRVLS